MRQRSAFDSSDAPDEDRFSPANHTTWTHPQSKVSGVVPRFSLPQRPISVESTLADAPENAPASAPTSKRPRRTKSASQLPASMHPAPAGEDASATPHLATGGLVRHSKALAVEPIQASTALTRPLDLAEPPSPEDIHLIPSPLLNPGASRRRRRWVRYGPSPRLNILKLSLIGGVLFVVLAATLATASGGKVVSLLFSAFNNAVPYAPAVATPALVTQRVHPITQADKDAGYDSPQQHDLYWNSACSAASLTEVLHAWGLTSITIGEVIDEMSAHNPPYITPWGGLMSQNGWSFIAQLHHFNATVQYNQSLSYDDIVRLTMQQGIPVIVGIADYSGTYPAFSVGHFLVVVGGQEAGMNIVDSSLYHITFLPHDEFEYLWSQGRGETIVITPANT